MTPSTSSARMVSDIVVKPLMSMKSTVRSRLSPLEMSSSTERVAASCRATRGSM